HLDQEAHPAEDRAGGRLHSVPFRARSDVRQLVAPPRYASQLGVGLAIVLEGLGRLVPDEPAPEPVGDVAQVAGVGRAVADLDVAGRPLARRQAFEEILDVRRLAVLTLDLPGFEGDLPRL